MNALNLSSLKTWHLKYWAFLTGVASSGTKAELQASLVRTLENGLNTPSARRIVSVDMGIRNLAYCAVEVPGASHYGYRRGLGPLKVIAWKRTDLLDHSALSGRDAETPTQDEPSKTKSKLLTAVDKEAFTLPALSKTAYSVVQDLLAYEPDTILIERQRFRSGGAAAIQEWTVRVNMLESMLWSCLEALRATSMTPEDFPRTHAVSPARVANFWGSGDKLPLRPPTDMFKFESDVRDLMKETGSGRHKIEKKDKVEMVRSWVAGNSSISLEFSDATAELAEAFKMEKSQAKHARELAGGKLDDLADCLLQAVAHVRWEGNGRFIHEMLLKLPNG